VGITWEASCRNFFFFPRNAATHKKNQFGTIFYGLLERALKGLKFKVLKKKGHTVKYFCFECSYELNFEFALLLK
jgi:hypothetical protein